MYKKLIFSLSDITPSCLHNFPLMWKCSPIWTLTFRVQALPLSDSVCRQGESWVDCLLSHLPCLSHSLTKCLFFFHEGVPRLCVCQRCVFEMIESLMVPGTALTGANSIVCSRSLSRMQGREDEFPFFCFLQKWCSHLPPHSPRVFIPSSRTQAHRWGCLVCLSRVTWEGWFLLSSIVCATEYKDAESLRETYDSQARSQFSYVS